MNKSQQLQALKAAEEAALAAGKIMRVNLNRAKIVNEARTHDLKLALDVRCQQLIQRALRKAIPSAAILGEEGIAGDQNAQWRWVVDPIDGTVNFAYGIPHACVAIALQIQSEIPTSSKSKPAGWILANGRPYETILGVIHDPFTNEMWSGLRGAGTFLNGRRVHVSKRDKLADAVVSVGFSKSKKMLQAMLPRLARLVHRVRKIRMLGAAALSLAYVAGGRLDVYVEDGVRLWDIAAGGLMVQCAGGQFDATPMPGDYVYAMTASNGKLRGI